MNQRFDAASSATYVASGVSDSITFVTGSVSGVYGTDKVCISDKDTACTATSFKFLAVTQAQDMTSIQSDGVCGLKPPQAGIDPIMQLPSQLHGSGAIDAKVFTFHLAETN